MKAPLATNRYLAEALAALGVTHFFSVPVIVPAAIKEMQALGIVPVMAHGEKAAAYMADGYARVTGRPGVCGAQAIGGTNLAAGLREAHLARIPIVALSGGKTLESQYRLQYQEIDDMPIYEALTKLNATVWTPERLPDLLAAAFRAATTGAPRPVHLELSGITGEVGVAGEIERPAPVDARYGSYPALRPAAPEEDVRAVLAAIEAAERPLLVIGGGVRSSGAGAEAEALARRLSLPVASALNAKGLFPEADSQWAGIVGEYSMECANRAACEADLVVYVGSLTGGLVTRSWSVPPLEAKVAHIDIDPENIGRNYPRTVGACGDARTVLRQLHDLASPGRDRAGWLARVGVLRAEWQRKAEPLEASDAVPMLVPRLCRELSEALPADAIVVADTGHAGAWLAQHVRASSPRQAFLRAHGSLGWALPAAIGAKLAAPQRPVVCFTGDGGFYYHLSELETAVRYDAHLVVVVNDNASLNQEQLIWGDDEAYARNWRHAPTDFLTVAEGFGCAGFRAETAGELGPALDAAIEAGRPAVVVARTDVASVPLPSWGPAGSHGMYPTPDAHA